MNTIITDTGFGQDSFTGAFTPLDAFAANTTPDALDLPSDADPDVLKDRLTAIPMIRIAFPSSADGRGFSIARRLRLMGYTGTLRAFGHVIADQYAMARRSGFDEVEIDDALAARQPETQWLARANWQAHDYQTSLRRSS